MSKPYYLPFIKILNIFGEEHTLYIDDNVEFFGVCRDITKARTWAVREIGEKMLKELIRRNRRLTIVNFGLAPVTGMLKVLDKGCSS